MLCTTCPFTSDDPVAITGHTARQSWLGQKEVHTMAVTKDQLIAHSTGGRNGKAHLGTRVRLTHDVVMAAGQPWEWIARAGEYEVVDLMARKSYTRPDHVGIGEYGKGVAFSAALADLEVVG